MSTTTHLCREQFCWISEIKLFSTFHCQVYYRYHISGLICTTNKVQLISGSELKGEKPIQNKNKFCPNTSSHNNIQRAIGNWMNVVFL